MRCLRSHFRNGSLCIGSRFGRRAIFSNDSIGRICRSKRVDRSSHNVSGSRRFAQFCKAGAERVVHRVSGIEFKFCRTLNEFIHAFRFFDTRELHQNLAFALHLLNIRSDHAETVDTFAKEVDGFGNVAACFLAQNAFDCGIAVVGIDAVHAVEFLRKADARHKFFIFLAEYADEIVFGVLARVCQRFVQLGILRVGSLGADDVGHGNLQRHGHTAF